MNDKNGTETNRREISLDEGLDYPLKRKQGNDNGMLCRVVQAPAVTEISKGPLQQYFWILDNYINFPFKTLII